MPITLSNGFPRKSVPMRLHRSFLVLLPLTLAFSVSADAAADTVLYQIDDGSGNVNIGPPSTFSADMLWGNYFQALPQGEQITELRVGLGTSYPRDEFSQPLPLTLYLYDDPDNDGDPTNATLVAATTIIPTIFTQTGFNTAPIEPTIIEGGFFVAARVFARAGIDRPARLDPQPSGGDQSWLVYAEEIKPDDLGASPFFTTMNDPENVVIFGAWMIRAEGQPKPPCADLDGNGTVDLDDLDLVLTNFGFGDGGDINGDGLTNLDDLDIVLTQFGQGCA